MHFDNTYVKIDLDIIRSNFEAVAQKSGVPVMAIVKADAYGHGAVQVARLLEGKCAFFGVSSMLEALELRQAGLTTPILILGQTPISAFPRPSRWASALPFSTMKPPKLCPEPPLKRAGTPPSTSPWTRA